MAEIRNFGDVDVATVTLPDILMHRSTHEGERLFLVDVNGGHATYSETLARAQRWAGALASLGIGEHTTVSTMLPNSVEATTVWIALTGLRAWETPVHPSYHGPMLEHAVNTVRSEVMLVDESFLPRVVESLPSMPAVKTVVVLGSASPASDLVLAEELLGSCDPIPLASGIPGRELAAIIYTSGTTGPSKGVMVPWAQLAAFSTRQFPYADLVADDRFYLFTPSSHIGAKSWPYLAAMLGGRLVIRPEFKTDRYLSDLKEYGVTTTAMLSVIAQFLSMTPTSPEDAELPLRNVVMAGLLADPDAFKARFGVRMCTAYSMTELSTPFTSDGWNVTNWESVGTLKGGHPGFTARVVDDDEAEVAAGEVGELILRTDAPWTLNAGYFGMPEATAEAWRNGWFHTGDGFRRDSDGSFYFVDRLKDAIRRRGENISSFEVEAFASAYPDVADCAAIAVPADVGEDEIKLCVVAQPGCSVDPAALVSWLAGRMPRFMVPRYVEVVDSLPRTVGTMRLQKAILRAAGITPSTWDRDAPR